MNEIGMVIFWAMKLYSWKLEVLSKWHVNTFLNQACVGHSVHLVS